MLGPWAYFVLKTGTLSIISFNLRVIMLNLCFKIKDYLDWPAVKAAVSHLATIERSQQDSFPISLGKDVQLSISES